MKIFNLEPEVQLSPCRRNLFAFTTLFIIILSIYSNTFNSSWHFDDLMNIKENKAIHMYKLNWQNIENALSAHPTEGKIYRPVACLTFALNYYLGETRVFGYHLVNTSIHILAAVFLFLFIYQTLNLPLLRPRYGSNAYLIALLAAVFWAINPVQTQAVTYIVQRMASMAAMFYIMAMYFFLKARISIKRSSRTVLYSACVVCCLLAFGSKENAAMLPFSILLFDLFLIQGITRKNIKKTGFIFFILLIIPLVLALVLKGSSVFDPDQILKQYETIRPFTVMERLLTEPRIILFYISLLLYPMPQRLSITHDITLSKSLIDPGTTIIAILVILAFLGACLIKSRKWPFISFCFIFFFMNHVIEGSIFGLELIFEHRNYLPSMLLFAPLAIMFVKGMQVYANKRGMQVILTIFVLLVQVGFAHSTFMRNYVWQTDGTLWADAVEKAPACIRPHINLAHYFNSQNRKEKGFSELMEALTSKILCNKSDGPLTLYNLGSIYQKKGELDLALEYYQKAEKGNPIHSDTHNNMGVVYLNKGLNDKAMHEFQRAIQCNGNNTKAYRNAALLLIKEKNIENGLAYLSTALAINANDGKVLTTAGYAHRLKGAYGKAFLCFEKALGIKPYDKKIHLYLSEIYFKRGLNAQAEKFIRKFIAEEQGKDLLAYVIGYAKEDSIDVIQPYKKKVLIGLAKAYKEKISFLGEKAKYLNERISETEYAFPR